MNNPYKAPESRIVDLSMEKLQTPDSLKKVFKLFWLALALWFAQVVVGSIFDSLSPPEIEEGITWSAFLLIMVFALSLYFVVYYLCLYRPLSKRKRGAARWWFWTATIMSILLGLSTYVEYVNGDRHKLGQLIESALLFCEMLVLFYGAELLSRPECQEHLIN